MRVHQHTNLFIGIVALALAACGSSESGDYTASSNHGGASGSGTGVSGSGAAGSGGVPSARCGFGKKECDSQCVRIDDPSYGCGDEGCQPCEVIHGKATCVSGQCAAGTCDAPFDDCDAKTTNGCETNTLTDANNCGSCGHGCSEGTFCNDGVCSNTCGDKTKCGSSCVDTTTDASNCGGCDQACPGDAHGQPTCSSGHCGVACFNGYSRCGNRCVQFGTDVNNCGSCGHDCSGVDHGTPSCTNGACSITCQTGYSRCGNRCVQFGTDVNNCGSCGHDCLGGACVAGQCQPVVLKSGIAKTAGIAAGAGMVYWLNREPESVWSMTNTGTGAKQLATTAKLPQSIALSGNTLYWVCRDGGEIQKAPTSGCASGGNSCVTTIYDQAVGSRDIEVAGGYIYFTSYDNKQVLRIPVSGGTAETIATEQGSWLTLTTMGTYLVWADYDNSVVRKRPLAGGSTTTVANLSVKPWGIQALGSTLYFVHYLDKTAANDEIMTIAPNATSAKFRAKSPRRAGFLATDGTALYWTTTSAEEVTGSGNRIVKMAK